MVNNMSRGRLRFSIQDDLLLLREVQNINPFEDSSRWTVIRENVVRKSSKQFSLRCIKEHADLLLKLWVRQDMTNLRRSGSKEQYKEKEYLLEQLMVLCSKYKDVSKRYRRQGNGRFLDEFGKSLHNTFEDTSHWQTSLDGEDTEYSQNESLTTVYGNNTFESNSNPADYNTDENEFIQPNLVDSIKEECTSIPNEEFLLEPEDICFNTMAKKQVEDIRVREILLEERKLKLDEAKLKLEEDRFLLERKEREGHLEIELEERREAIAREKQRRDIIDILLKQIGNN